MLPVRYHLSWSRTAYLMQFSKYLTKVPNNHVKMKHSAHKSNILVVPCEYDGHFKNNHLQNCSRVSSFHTMNCRLHSSPQLQNQCEKDKISLISTHMTMRLLNENSFLSWCRNAYLSSVVGIAMMDQATSTLAQSAGFGAIVVGGMNLLWGTGCHVINLVRLRQAAGMSGVVLTLNIMGSMIHCLLWLSILVCYIGFLDESDGRKKSYENTGRQQEQE